MTNIRQQVELWFDAEGPRITAIAASLRESEAAAISAIRDEIAALDETSDANERIDTVRRDIASLERCIADAKERLCTEFERRLNHIRELLEHLAHADVANALRETDELFQKFAIEDLRVRITEASPAMLEADLSQSSIATWLAKSAATRLAKCVERLRADASIKTELGRLETEISAAEESMRSARERLKRHGVSQEVTAALLDLDDERWFFHDVVSVYQSAADAESEMRLPTHVLPEFENG